MASDLSGLWGIITIAGPLILAIAVLWAIAHNKRSRAEKERTEQAVRDQRNEERATEGLDPK